MKISKICEVFSLFADITTDEAIKYMPVIYATQKNVEENLRDKSYADEYAYELELLCGAKVFYDYILTKSASTKQSSSYSDSSVKIGGVSISESSKQSSSENSKLSENVAYAKELCAKYQLLATNLFVDNQFIFGSV